MSDEILEMEVDNGELLAEHHKLSTDKQALQGQLTELKAKRLNTIPFREFQAIKKHRAKIATLISQIEVAIGKNNEQRAELNAIMQVRKRQSAQIGAPDVKRLVEMRDKYHAISMDVKCHQKAREIAWKISQELREFLKPTFAHP